MTPFQDEVTEALEGYADKSERGLSLNGALDRIALAVERHMDDYTQQLKDTARKYCKQYPDADINDFIGLIVGTRAQQRTALGGRDE